MTQSWERWLTVFGLGRLRPAPGTWGSLPPVVVAAAMVLAGAGPDASRWIFSAVMLLGVLVFSWACVAHGDRAEARFGRKDPSQVVADETAGQCVALLLLPASGFSSPLLSMFTLGLAFVAFRAMDIVKPWPAWRLQSVPAGWGILLDDLVAGLYAGLIVVVCAALAS